MGIKVRIPYELQWSRQFMSAKTQTYFGLMSMAVHFWQLDILHWQKFQAWFGGKPGKKYIGNNHHIDYPQEIIVDARSKILTQLPWCVSLSPLSRNESYVRLETSLFTHHLPPKIDKKVTTRPREWIVTKTTWWNFTSIRRPADMVWTEITLNTPFCSNSECYWLRLTGNFHLIRGSRSPGRVTCFIVKWACWKLFF